MAVKRHAGRLCQPVTEVVHLLLVLPDQLGGMAQDTVGQPPVCFAEAEAQIFVEPLQKITELSGVFFFGARRSATKSAIVKSISCPTAEFKQAGSQIYQRT